MAKKVVASLRDTSGVKYAKLITSVKSEKTGAYSFKEEVVIEDYVKDILAGKSHEDIIRELRAKEKESEAVKQTAAPKEEKQEEAPKEEAATPKEEKQEEAPKEEAAAPKEEKQEEAPEPKEEEKK